MNLIGNQSPEFREVELELSVKRGTDRTEALVKPLLIVLKLASEIVLQQNLLQISLGRHY